MIVLTEGNARFNFRVVGVAFDKGRVLLHRGEQDDFWALPGGRVELLEMAQTALEREMREELNAEVQVERLLWVAEYLFAYEGLLNHEIGFYFLMSFPPGSPVTAHTTPFMANEEGVRLIMQWFSVEEVGDLQLYPIFLRTRLQKLKAGVEHVAQVEDSYLLAVKE